MIGNIGEIAVELAKVAQVMPEASVMFLTRGTAEIVSGGMTPEELEAKIPGTVANIGDSLRVPTIRGTSFSWHPVDSRDPKGKGKWWGRFHC